MNVPRPLRIDAGGLAFEFDPVTGRAAIDADTRLTAPRGRFWTLSAVTAEDRDAPVHSEEQSGRADRIEGGLRIVYDRLVTADGVPLATEVEIEVTTSGDELVFTGRVNATTGVVRELTLPIVELAEETEHADEVLVRAEGLGRRIPTPRERLGRAHTEYMVDDDAGIWESCAYPGEFSMPWHGVQLAQGFLYVGRHDPEFSSVLLSSGIPRRGGSRELWLGATTPVGRATGLAGPVVVRLLPGDWRAGARRYRDWADTWYTGPHAGARSVQGWQRIIMRHQFGQVLFRYDELVDVFERGRLHGLDGILLFGWWRRGFDRGYPVYEADDELGGASALAAAIAEIRARGGWVSLYANGNLIDRTSEYARDEAAAVTKKDRDGLDYIDGYAFARESRTLRHFSAGSFLIACHGAPRWRERMKAVAGVHASFGTDSVFFDQTAYHLAAWPCFDATHDHGERVGIESRYRAQTLAAIRAAAGGAAVGSEGMADCMIGALDFHHGWGFAFQDGDEAFPAVFRTVFPEPLVSNRLIHDERPGWADQLNWAFAHNLVFDVALHRSRRPVDHHPAYAAHVARLIALRREHEPWFRDGAFELVAESPVHHVRYTVGADAIDVLWNRGDTPVTVLGTTVAPHDVAVRAGGAS